MLEMHHLIWATPAELHRSRAVESDVLYAKCFAFICVRTDSNAILKWPELMNVKQVHAFLGLSNFYRCFIKDYTIISCPMVDLTCKDIIFNFGDKEKALFEDLKAAFTTAPILQYPNQDCEFRLETDMSEFAIGGVISVKCDDSEFRPIAYMSHSMTPPE